jgi:hypothetical protein
MQLTNFIDLRGRSLVAAQRQSRSRRTRRETDLVKKKRLHC